MNVAPIIKESNAMRIRFWLFESMSFSVTTSTHEYYIDCLASGFDVFQDIQRVLKDSHLHECLIGHTHLLGCFFDH